MPHRTLWSVVALFLISALRAAAQTPVEDAEWEPLFNGRDLSGWTRRNGQATYSVRDGAIVGRTVLDSPNSFLCSNEHFSDFILELEFKVDPELNSGIQIRSNSLAEYQSGRVHGYQVEIDPSERAFSGGVYDEARRGWLKDLGDNEAARKAFRQNDWNKFRIEAIGPKFRTWLNGVAAVDFEDAMTPSGFIGLQVHGVGNDKKKDGIEVTWRNIRIRRLGPAISTEEKAEGWRLLFDGKTSTGWRSAKSEKFPEKGWQVKDGELRVEASGGGESTNGGDIVTEDLFADFDLSLEFKLRPGANSGIKYFVVDGLNKGAGSAIGLEYQLLDDALHPDAKAGKNGNRTLASLYDLIPAQKSNVPFAVDAWQKAMITVRGRNVEHFLNGVRVVAYERGGDEFRKLVAESKYKIYPGFGEAEKGRILLQDHGDRVSFRNIKIRTPVAQKTESQPTSAPAPRNDAGARAATDPLKGASAASAAREIDPWREVVGIAWGEAQIFSSAIETEVLAAGTEGRAAVEKKLIGVLGARDVTPAAIDIACRMLRIVGSETAVAKLAELAADAATAGPALYALAAIPSAEVDRTLSKVVANASGAVKESILATLKDRADRAGKGQTR